MHRSNRLAENQSSLPGKTKFLTVTIRTIATAVILMGIDSPLILTFIEESLRSIVNRLSRIEGHIRGIKTMVQESRPCPDVLVQMQQSGRTGSGGADGFG